MVQYNTLNVKLSNQQLNKLKFGIKSGTEVTLKLSSNVIDDSNDENIFPHKLLFTNTLVLKLRKAFANVSSANIKLSKIQLPEIVQSGGLLGRRLGPLLKFGLPLIKNVFKPLAKSVLTSLDVTAAAAAAAAARTEAAILMKIFGSGNRTLMISNGKRDDIMKIIKSFEESGLLIKRFQ